MWCQNQDCLCQLRAPLSKQGLSSDKGINPFLQLEDFAVNVKELPVKLRKLDMHIVTSAYPEEGVIKGVVLMLEEGVLLPCTSPFIFLCSFLF